MRPIHFFGGGKMQNRIARLIAFGGGEFAEAEEVVDEFLESVKDKNDARVAVITAATEEPEGAGVKYNNLFRGRDIPHVNAVNVSEREDSFDRGSLEKIEEADALFFTGGDQLHVTSLIGGSPLHNLIHKRYREGVAIAGTSAGAMMMSSSIIISGASDQTPKIGAVEIAPGMDIIKGTIIDTHFSQRGRHGRLLTAVAHYPQVLGLGIDEGTALKVENGHFRVIGKGVVTVVDGSLL